MLQSIRDFLKLSGPPKMSTDKTSWWKEGVVYQIYPASFQDSNDDGIGDLPGITKRLEYIKDLGATIIWISPMYDSPQHDMGYDIRNYKKVYPPYGTMSDMKKLLSKAHFLGLKVILDLVINHTSDEHAWFQESRSSKTNPKRNWYIWKPATYSPSGERLPPNNWASYFGGSAWQWDNHTQEYYLHLFAKEQPDVNFENEEARKTLYADSMNFWLDLGVDGFRIDTVSLYSKDQTFPDAPITDPGNPYQHPGSVVSHGPRIHEFIREMGSILESYGAMSVGECGEASNEEMLRYVGAIRHELNSIFLFDVVDVGHGHPLRYTVPPHTWKVPQMSEALKRTQRVIVGTDAWTTSFMENHDVARSVSRFGDDSSPETWKASGKMLALMQATLSGTQYIYEGQEIGMINIPLSWSIEEEYKDIESQRWWHHIQKLYADDSEKLAAAKLSMQHLARDNARTPMQWAAGKNGGFTSESAKPWMRVNGSASWINVEQQEGDKDSILMFWRKMLGIRKKYTEVFVYGEFELLEKDSGSVVSFTKTADGVTAVVYCNFTNGSQPIPKWGLPGDSELLVSSVEEVQGQSLQPREGRVVLIRKKQ